ncbi:efflux RND transporter permease subunit [SAR92 clade bacterium H921]|nr:efflux RND transporter permease subunit [SAR92 clade bacterium H921]
MKNLINWFVHNPIAANLLMVLILISGAMGASSIGKEVFPAIPINYIDINMPYPGAGPREVEEQIVIRIEEAIYNLDGIKHITSEARKGRGRVTIEVVTGHDMNKMLNDIKSRVDSITTFPRDAERPIVMEQILRNEVIRVALFGDADETVLKKYGERIRDDLAALSDVDHAELSGIRSPQIDIELSEAAMRRYGISFNDVVTGIQRSSLNLPAGTIRSATGDIQIQTRGQAYFEDDFNRIAITSRADGSEIKISDVAIVKDTFEERNSMVRFNGQAAVFLGISVGNQPDVVATTNAVKRYIAEEINYLPAELSIATWADFSTMFSGRLELLSANAFGGLVLVFIVLMLFLRPQLAFWVALGIAIAYMGALWILPSMGLTLNMLSMFAFLLILGIIVDDAIVVGESVFRHQQEGYDHNTAAQLGAQAVSKPVILAVVSTMIVFIPMLFLPGIWPKMLWAIPAVAIVALSFSLIESLLILPSHLAQMKPEKEPKSEWGIKFYRLRQWFALGMTSFAKNKYQPLLIKALDWRYLTLVIFTLAFALSITLVGSGYIKQRFMPSVSSDIIQMKINMPDGYARASKLEIIKRAEEAVLMLSDDPLLVTHKGGADLTKNQLSFMWGDHIRLILEITPEYTGTIDPRLVAERWRHHIGKVPDAKSFEIEASLSRTSSGQFSALLSSPNVAQLQAATVYIKEQLRQVPGTTNIRDNIHSGRSDLDISLRPNADNLGISLSDVALQVRQGFYGAEAQRIPRGRDDIRVMVRYPKSARAQVDTLEDLRVRTVNGAEIPFYSVAKAEYVPSYSRINRRDRERSVKITAQPLLGVITLTEIADIIYGEVAAEIAQKFPQVSLEKDAELADQEDFYDASFELFTLALAVIYMLMAIEFKSYLKPLGVLSAVPFGIMGAIFGHLLMGLDFSILSLLGVLAASGVVVNDNLVLIDRITQLREEGFDVKEALIRGGQERFRPIILTSITTFIGLAPILLETSMQANFLIPMVSSLAFGVLFATTVTLVFVPCLYLAGANLKAKFLQSVEVHSST